MRKLLSNDNGDGSPISDYAAAWYTNAFKYAMMDTYHNQGVPNHFLAEIWSRIPIHICNKSMNIQEFFKRDCLVQRWQLKENI